MSRHRSRHWEVTALGAAALLVAGLGWGLVGRDGGTTVPSAEAAPAVAAPAQEPTAAAVRVAPRPWSGTVRDEVTAPLPPRRPYAAPPPGPRLMGRGDAGPQVRELQARLRQIAWVSGDVDDVFDPELAQAVRGFQEKRRIAVTGEVDQRTLDRLDAMTREPTADELANRFPGDVDTDAALDARCLTGRVLCVDKSSSTLRWVVDGHVAQTLAVRFGSEYTPTREGEFAVASKSRDHVSSIYDTAMPFAMFFSGGQAVHYSADFAARGYAGASHGCVNVRDLAGITRLFDEVQVGDRVVVYWS